VESVRALADVLVAALNVRDLAGVQAALQPDAQFRSILGSVDGEIYVGHEGVARYFSDLLDTFESTIWRVLDVEEGTDDRFILTLEIAAKGRVSGAEVTYALPNVLTMRDGLIARDDVYRDRDEARRAAGID
jgi:ketosteroid isomerase-like protein